MNENLNNYFECIFCYAYGSIKKDNNFYFCTVCNNYYTNSNKKISTNPSKTFNNKLIHLNNVIKNLENSDNIENNNLLEKLKERIEKFKINDYFIDSMYVSEFLKENKIKSYIRNFDILNKIKEEKINLSIEDKEKIKIIFDDFINFLYQYKYLNSTISYPIALDVFLKYLKITKNLKPTSMRSNGRNLRETILNYYMIDLCRRYLNVSDKKIIFHYKPNIIYTDNTDLGIL